MNFKEGDMLNLKPGVIISRVYFDTTTRSTLPNELIFRAYTSYANKYIFIKNCPIAMPVEWFELKYIADYKTKLKDLLK